MDSIEFIAIIVVLAAILAWYIHNVRAGADGHAGWFALRQDGEAHSPSQLPGRNRPQKAGAEGPVETTEMLVGDSNPNTQSRRKFRRQEKARYRVKEKAVLFKPHKAKRPA